MNKNSIGTNIEKKLKDAGFEFKRGRKYSDEYKSENGVYIYHIKSKGMPIEIAINPLVDYTNLLNINNVTTKETKHGEGVSFSTTYSSFPNEYEEKKPKDKNTKVGRVFLIEESSIGKFLAEIPTLKNTSPNNFSQSHALLESKKLKKSSSENNNPISSIIHTDERDRIGKTRYGQGSFRDALIKIKGDVCWMSGIKGRELLVASHIKRWSDCKSEFESTDRGNINNGLLLSALWDAAFDSYLITFDEQWRVIPSKSLSESAKQALGLTSETSLPKEFQNNERMNFLCVHRAAFDKKESTRQSQGEKP